MLPFETLRVEPVRKEDFLESLIEHCEGLQKLYPDRNLFLLYEGLLKLLSTKNVEARFFPRVMHDNAKYFAYVFECHLSDKSMKEVEPKHAASQKALANMERLRHSDLLALEGLLERHTVKRLVLPVPNDLGTWR